MIKQLPYGVQTDKKILHRAEPWCRDQWGQRWDPVRNRAGSWCVFWGGNSATMIPYHYQWWFATEQQQTLFMLRWS